MPDMLGNGIPKFTGTGTPDSTTRTLVAPVPMNYNFSDKESKILQSVINGTRTFKHKGRHGAWVIKEQLYKCTTSPTPAQWFTTLCSYEHQDIVFYLSSDATAPAIKDTSGSVINCHVMNVDLTFEILNGLLKPVAILTIVTTEPYDISRLTL